jgi:hypothetical protein
MQEFETFVYLDVQKTGSSFLSRLLQLYSSEKELRFRKHGRGDRKYDPSKFYFISVRDPLDQYLSLYSHGCGGYGGLYHRLRELGHDELYDSTWAGFKKWLKFALKPESAAALDDKYGEQGKGKLCELIGFQTYRFLELAIQDSLETLDTCQTQDDIRKAYAEKKIATYTIRNETFTQDVEELLTTKLRNSIADLDGALKFLKEADRINASDRVDRFEEDPKVGPKNKKYLRQREWLLRELFDY